MVDNITNIIQKQPIKVNFFPKTAENPTFFRYLEQPLAV